MIKKTVTIPAPASPLDSMLPGFSRTVTTLSLEWCCLACGDLRGEPVMAFAYDGSRRLEVHSWTNPCGHVESYQSVLESIDEDDLF